MPKNSDQSQPPWLMARWVSFGFIFGILLHNARPLEIVPWWIPMGLCAVGVFLFWATSAVADRLCFSSLAPRVSLLLFACALGLLRFDFTLPGMDDPLYKNLGANVTMNVEVEDLGKFDAILQVKEIDGQSIHSRSKLSVTSAGKGMKIGERWRVSCRIEKNEKTEMKQVLFDARKGIFFRCRGSISARRIEPASQWNIKMILASWRSMITKRIYRLIPGDEGALLAGILYGERGLSSQENAAFRMAGMTHLIAVSGSNISLVIGLFVPIFLFLGYRRKTSIFFSGFAVLLFSLFVGASASVLRAALMGWFGILARVFGRRADAYHLLLIVGTLMIVFDPWALGFDAGFALSFLATWGLLVPGQVISRHLKWIPEVADLREAFSTTLAASLATAPYQLWAFGSVSLLGLVTNLFAIPLTAFTMAWGAIACVAGDLHSVIILPAKGMLTMMLMIADFAERYPIFVIQYQLPLWMLLLMIVFGFALFQGKMSKLITYPQFEAYVFKFLSHLRSLSGLNLTDSSSVDLTLQKSDRKKKMIHKND